jgi:hypothetical protein
MRITLIFFITAVLLTGCSKMEEKKQNQPETKQSATEMQNPNAQGNMQDGSQNRMENKNDLVPETAVDAKADKLIKEANDFENVYKKNNSDNIKSELMEKHLSAGIYLMYEAKLNPKKKYGPALKQFNRVLELDPENPEAINNKMQIEEIFMSLGRPMPN